MEIRWLLTYLSLSLSPLAVHRYIHYITYIYIYIYVYTHKITVFVHLNTIVSVQIQRLGVGF